MAPSDSLNVSVFADAFRDSPVATIILSAEGNVLFWNPAAERTFEWTAAEVVGKPLPFIPAEKTEEHREMRKQDLQGHGFTGRQISRVRKSGSRIDLSVSTAPIRDADGRVTGIISVYTDISAEKRTEETLRRREESINRRLLELESIYSTAAIGLAFIDPELRYVRVNQCLAQMHDLPVEAHIGKRVREVRPEFGEQLETICREILQTGRPLLECELGAGRDWLVSCSPLRDPEGRVLGLTAVLFDITDRKRLTAELRHSEAQLRLVIDGMPGLVAYIDREYRYLFVNRGYGEWFNLKVSQIEGKLVAEVLGDPWFQSLRPYLDRALQGEFVTFERRSRYGHGERDVRASYVPDRGPNGETRGVVALVQDVTIEAAALAALRDSEERFRRIVEIASEGIWIVDPEGRTTFSNRRMAEILGYSNDELLGRLCFDLLHPEDRPRGETSFLNRKAGDTRPHEYRAIRKDGAVVWLDFTGAPIHDDNGNLVGVLAMCTDITERKHSEHQLRQTQKLESLGVLAGGIAHDFNNLLVGIMGNASLALDTLPPDADAVQMLRDVVAASERAAQLTRQLLSYAGKSQRSTAPISIKSLVTEIANLLRTSIPRAVNLSVRIAPGIPNVDADSGQLQQVLMNLVINAAESIPEGAAGDVTIAVESRVLTQSDRLQAIVPIEMPAQNYVVISVSDTGAGMDGATQARIFDPFFSTKFAGRGLGLSAVLGIVRAHQGTLTLRSAPGTGTVFSVLLPATTAQTDTPPAASAVPRKGTGVILVVDDESTVRDMTQRALTRYGYTVILAENGREGVDAVRTHPEIRAVILDLAMPVLTGDRAATEMRAMRQDLPILLSSGYSESEATRLFAQAGVTRFLQKPYPARVLVEALRATLSA